MTLETQAARLRVFYYLIKNSPNVERITRSIDCINKDGAARFFPSRRLKQMRSVRNSRFPLCNRIYGVYAKRALTMDRRYDISYICQFIKVLLMDYNEGAVRVVRNRRESP